MDEQDLSQLSDDEFMAAWTAAGEKAAAAQAECDAYGAEHHRRLAAAEEARAAAKAGAGPSELDQTVGSVE